MNNNNNQRKQSTGINNPVNSIGGKILIWVLLGTLVLSPIIGLIFLLLN